MLKMDDKMDGHISLTSEIAHSLPERIMCAATHFNDRKQHPHQPINVNMGYVICGHRHHNCLYTNAIIGGEKYPDMVQGFLTTKNRFLDRREAMTLARQYLDYLPEKQTALFSEDLW